MTVDATIDKPAGREKVRATGNLVRDILDRNHGVKKDYSVTVPLDRLEQAERTQDIFTGLLFLIASISLVVGGIRILKLMLATPPGWTPVVARPPPLGAQPKVLRTQFL